MRHTKNLIYYSQLSLLIGVCVCIAFNPEVVFNANQGGVSNYGTELPTLYIFCSAVLLSAHLLHRVALSIARLKGCLQILASWYVALVLSTLPYKVNASFENIHIVIAFGLALYQILLAGWLAWTNSFDTTTFLALGLMAISFGIGVLTILQIVNQLFSSQFLGGVGFGILLVHSVSLQLKRK